MEFKHKTAVVTGAARGIGQAVCEALAAEAGRVVIVDINAQGAELAAASIRESGGDALALGCDVSSDTQVQAVAQAVALHYGHADILINNAVAHPLAPGNVDDIDIERWSQALDINVLGYVRLLKAFVPGMLARGSGYVVTTSSSLAILPNAATRHMLPYVTSKGAALGLSYGLSHGFRHDQHSISHVCLAANPMMTEDELGLLGKFDLNYKFLDIPSITLFPDGSHLCLYKDIDRTCESIAQFSQRDADTYRKHANFGRRVVPMFLQGMYSPPAPMGAFLSMLDQSQEGRDLFQMMTRSPLDILNYMYESDKVKIHFMQPVAQLLQMPDDMGTGLCMLMIPGLMHTYVIPKPVGGSGRLTDALIRCFEHYGGEMVMESEVSKVVTRHGRAVGLETSDGQLHVGKDAVLAAIHPKRLERFIDGLDEDLIRRANRVKSSPFNILTAHYAINEKAKFVAGDVVIKASATEYATTTDFKEFVNQFEPLRRGEVIREQLMFSGSDQSYHDPSRAPAGKGVMLTQAFVPYFLKDGGPQRWDEYKHEVADMILDGMRPFISNFTADNIIARTVDSPLDHERHSPNSFVYGDEHGLGSYFFQGGSNRPIAELSNYTVPGVGGLYLCGPFMHPSGGVFGGGRATAIKMFEDLGLDFHTVAAADRVRLSRTTGFEKKAAPLPEAQPETAMAANQSAGVAPADLAASRDVVLYGADGEKMMTISALEQSESALLIKGRIYGTVPLLAKLQPEDVRKALGLLNWRLIPFLISMLFRRSSKAPPAGEGAAGAGS